MRVAHAYNVNLYNSFGGRLVYIFNKKKHTNTFVLEPHVSIGKNMFMLSILKPHVFSHKKRLKFSPAKHCAVILFRK